MSGFFKSSVGRKIAMALSAFFLMFFLLQHFAINLLSVLSPDTFNEVSHFMGTNPLIQFALQPVLIFGVVFHFVMGFILELKNKKANGVGYAKNNGAANSSWMSRNMIWSGAAILAFIILHFIDFWFPEINTKFIQGDWSGTLEGIEGYRYHEELLHKFVNPIRVAAYVVAFVFLGLHLAHGFTSAFQSMGSTSGRKKTLQTIGKAYSIIIPLGFIFIALYHYLNH
ncbi:MULTISPECIES: succinate dehydrogenase cytochrome b subunit [unclassified Polaribacter]|jgi:succinate dehydrogenase / fumarate reductase cytochrome b subunit|uniref:succinate dehydrogenase cytochrome b subunit n=1 Tax=unclassified Polaribacter TaxID=196858 RepID=UPI001C501359|nr:MULTISPECIES: succinate dehydrogenase cytochrome b subunit [unclassified Polaribacter]QXP63723.1 succinate dehydrogenase cytochrome b subunit [Polaribacter sp. HaHaR_3_91]QXP66230.1 succinate dehydrogenase cytochrome b subunit [Polaribacter sp. AHE13PA]QXP71716.1 succinate dehydrogenase cytochrome b subunit [Polaribacter sp. R2A056_3_33]